MTTIDLGRAFPVSHGDWVSGGGKGTGGAYERLSIVRHLGKTWISAVETTEEPTNGATDWNIMVEDTSTGFKNYIINGGFDVAQRGTSHAITQFSQYTLDRFVVWGNGSTVGTKTVTQENLYGNEGFKTKKFLKHTNTTLGTGETGVSIIQRIEDAKTLGGKTVTFSCLVNFSMNVPVGSLSMHIAQNTNGGSPNTATTGLCRIS